MTIAEKYQQLREEIPNHVTIVLAGKTKTAEEIKEVIDAGATDLGENYIQEAEEIVAELGEQSKDVRWHMIGHLQKNKINKALPIFDVIQTVGSMKKARDIDKRVEKSGKKAIPVFIEINIGNEDSKSGIMPEDHEPFEKYMEQFVRDISELEYLRLEGLMTMGPRFGDPENSRPYFKRTKQIFDTIKAMNIPNVDFKYLSMGTSNSYKVAIEEGSNMVRLGTVVFGKRDCDI
ncbi:MAG: YggS family pyridoxal phosphate-dependent enzyme [Bacteroidales bacterium]